MPVLGDDKTPIEKVERFYACWYSFKSWRTFAQVDEYELEEAECREERRWMERQNKKLRDRARREEKQRINRLVEVAESLDPRIAKYKAEQEAQKKREQEAKEEALRKRREEVIFNFY